MSKEGVGQAECLVLRERMQEVGVRAVLFDLDDTLFKTYFTEGRRIYKVALEAKLGYELVEKEFMAEWYGQWRELKKTHGVHPRFHRQISEVMAAKYGFEPLPDDLEAAYGDMCEVIYKTVPEEMPGTKETVAALKEAEIGVYVVTHAEEDWTELKLSNWQGVFDGVHCVDVNNHKDAAAWAEALEEFGLSPAEVAVVGDNVEADIEPMARLGVRYKFRMSASWGPTSQPLPAETWEIDNLYQIVEFFLDGKGE